MRRSRSMGRSEGMGLGAWLGIGLGVFVVLAAIGLTIYGGSVHPTQHAVEQVLSNDRFPG